MLSTFLISGAVLQAQLKVGDNPTTINPNSILEMESTNKGMLLPRLGLSSTTAFTPLAAHVAGMTVYNTATAGDVTPGFYYNDGSKWVRLFSTSTALNTTAANNLVTITNGTGATLTAMTVGIDTTALKSFISGKTAIAVTAPLTGNGTTASPISIPTGDLSAGTLLTTTGAPTAALLKTAGYNVDTTALKTFISNAINNGAITGKNTTAGSLVTVTNGAGAAIKDNTIAVDTTALKTFVSNAITNGAIVGKNTTAGPLTTITNGTGATLTAMTVGIDTTALKTFVTGNIAKNTTAGSLVTVTNGAGAALKDNTIAVDTTALKSFVSGKTAIAVTSPLTGDGTTASPISITRATATSGVLTTVTNGTNATFTALQYDVDTTALKTFIAGRTTNTLTNPTNTITSTVNGVAATAPAVNTVSNAFSNTTRELTTTVNGVASTAVVIPTTPDSTTADNGLTETANKIQLGGALVQPTTITTTAANTLALAGLQSGTSADSAVVASGAAGTLKKISISTLKRLAVVTTAATAYTISDTADVVIFNGTANTTFTLPAASASYGRELRILNYAAAASNTTITLSTPIIVEGNTTSETSTIISSRDTSVDFPLGIASRNVNTITLISNGTDWYKLGN